MLTMQGERVNPVPLGARCLGESRCSFRVWAPFAERVEVKLVACDQRVLPLERQPGGYWQLIAGDVEPGCLYVYLLHDGHGGILERPDPASRHQPDGVHGPSQVPDLSFEWTDGNWRGIPLPDYVIYELHVGTFTPAGTFEGVIPQLDALSSLGITAIEIMPVGQFPGPRNWGYDGAYPFAVQTTYGGPEGLKRLVDACHRRGLAVVLDVVYNHLGPEGNYLADFGPYFSERYHTMWGASLNFDGPYSDPVRDYFVQNMLYWIEEHHVDALRLDAVHAILDFSAGTFLEQLAAVVDERRTSLRRLIYLLAESDLNDSRIVRPREVGGYDLDAQWSDDFHHSLHTLLTGEQNGYYADFVGDEGEAHVATLARAIRDGYVYSGQYSRVRRRRHGNSARSVPGHRFIVSLQNHDQVGNRAAGDRLSASVSFERLKLGAGVLLLAPYIPLIFMGEEYGEKAPFQYFVSHSDTDLIEAVRAGRRNEFAAFAWQEDVPDPQDESTFMRSKLNLDLRTGGHHKLLWLFYQELLRLRRALPALAPRPGTDDRAAVRAREGAVPPARLGR